MKNNKTLRFAVRKFDPFEKALDKIWNNYCEDTGCKLDMEAVPMDLHKLHRETLEDGGLKSGNWDIAHLNTDWIMEAYNSEAVEMLNPYIEQDPPQDFPEGWAPSLRKMQEFNNKIYGLPFHDGPECLIYRKDLFEDSNEKKKYKEQFGKALKVPEKWGEFQRIARFFQRPEENLYGSVFAAFPDGHNTVFDFCLQLWTRGGTLRDRNGRINIDNEAAEKGLTYYRQIMNDKSATHPDCSDFDSVKSGVAFANGEVAMMVNWFGFALMSEFSDDSKTSGKVDIASVPSGTDGEKVSLNTYWLYTIGSGSTKKKNAYDFIRYAVNAANDKLLTIEGGTGCRLSTWKDEEINKIVPYYHRLEKLHENAKELPRRNDWSKIASVIDEIVLETINSNKPVEQIIKVGQQKLDRL